MVLADLEVEQVLSYLEELLHGGVVLVGKVVAFVHFGVERGFSLFRDSKSDPSFLPRRGHLHNITIGKPKNLILIQIQIFI